MAGMRSAYTTIGLRASGSSDAAEIAERLEDPNRQRVQWTWGGASAGNELPLRSREMLHFCRSHAVFPRDYLISNIHRTSDLAPKQSID